MRNSEPLLSISNRSSGSRGQSAVVEWPKFELKDLIEIKHGFAFDSAHFRSEGPYVLLTPGNFREQGGFRWLGEKQKYYVGAVPQEYVLSAGRLLIAMTEQAPGLLGSTIFVPAGRVYLHNQRLGLIRIKDRQRTSDSYLYYLFNAPFIRREISASAAGTKVRHTSPGRLLHLAIRLPPLGEQRRIGHILETWDEAIKEIGKLESLQEQRLTALHQRIFEFGYSSGSSLPPARVFFEAISERARPDLPLLAVMQDVGIVRRDQLDRRVVMPDGDTSTYKVVRPNDFVISLRSFEGGLEYSNMLGLVSPAYTVLRPTKEIHSAYYRHFFKSRSFIGRLDKMIFGIRDGKQIAFRDFGDMRIPNPAVEVQRAHAEILDAAATELDGTKRRRKALECQKRGLVQKLLTGEWRVAP